jgi:hypothetical protein
MSLVTYIFAIAAALTTLILVVLMLRRGRLRERHAVWWITGAFLALIVSIFPVTLDWATHLVGFNLSSNLVYFVSIVLLVLIGIQHSSELTKVEAQLRTLAEEVALMRLDVEQGTATPAVTRIPNEATDHSDR